MNSINMVSEPILSTRDKIGHVAFFVISVAGIICGTGISLYLIFS